MTTSTRLSREQTRELLRRDFAEPSLDDEFVALLAASAGTDPTRAPRLRLRAARVVAAAFIVGATSLGAAYAVHHLNVLQQHLPGHSDHPTPPTVAPNPSGQGTDGSTTGSGSDAGDHAAAGNDHVGQGHVGQGHAGQGHAGQGHARPVGQGNSATHRQDQSGHQPHASQPDPPPAPSGGHSHGHGRPDSPGQSSSPHGRPDSPGQSSSPHGRPDSPGQSSSPHGRPDSPGHSTAPHGQPEDPGHDSTPSGSTNPHPHGHTRAA